MTIITRVFVVTPSGVATATIIEHIYTVPVRVIRHRPTYNNNPGPRFLVNSLGEAVNNWILPIARRA